MQILLGQGQELPERARMAHNTEHAATGTMAAHPAPAPFARSTSEVDFSNHAAPCQAAVVRRHDFAYEFMTGSPAKSVVAALQFEIRIADPSQKQPDQCESGLPRRTPNLANFNAAVFKMNG
jgi:hypothetical protein